MNYSTGTFLLNTFILISYSLLLTTTCLSVITLDNEKSSSTFHGFIKEQKQHVDDSYFASWEGVEGGSNLIRMWKSLFSEQDSMLELFLLCQWQYIIIITTLIQLVFTFLAMFTVNRFTWKHLFTHKTYTTLISPVKNTTETTEHGLFEKSNDDSYQLKGR